MDLYLDMKPTELHKAKEKIWAEAFIKSFGKVAEIEIRNPPEPDIILKFKDNTQIGLEITQYLGDYEKVSKESNWNRIRWKLHNKLVQLPKDNLLKKMSCNLKFKNKIPKKSQDDQFISELISFTESLIPNIHSDKITEFIPSKEYKLLHKYLESINLKRTNCVIYLWNSFDLSGGLIQLFPENIIQRIEEKNHKYFGYEKGSSKELWLLIVCDTVATVWSSIPWLEEILELLPQDYEVITQSPYQHIYLFSFSDKRNICLK